MQALLRTAYSAAFLMLVWAAPALADNECNFTGKIADTENATPVALHRGVNLSSWWEDDRSRALRSADDIHALHQLGFDFVRLPVSPTWFINGDEDDRADNMQKLRCDVISLMNEGLKVVLDLHPAGPTNNPLIAVGSEAFWRMMQPALADLPPQRLLIGLFNEPHLDDTDFWWAQQGKLVDKLRPLYPRFTFVVTPSPASGWWELEWLEPYKDKNLIYDVHFYEPMIFTHHGAEWLNPTGGMRATEKITYPSNQMDMAGVTDPDLKKYVDDTWTDRVMGDIMKRIAHWRDKHHVEVACLEFGVYRLHVDDQSRLAWLHDVRTELERQHIPWALWEYRGPFGLIERGDIDEFMADTLGLGHSNAP